MNAMRLTLPTYNPLKECQGCSLRDETKVSAQILSFQLADQLLRRYSGTWKLTRGELHIHLKGLDFPLSFELGTGALAYGSLRTQVIARYTPDLGVAHLAGELVQDLALPSPSFSENHGFQDPLFALFVKLIEIFHARCGLDIVPVEKDKETVGWEIFLCEDGPRGWISTEGIAENRFGERADIKEWFNLRPEKLATYVFGFNKFCKNYPSPFRIL